jgi:hypothetical protein
MKVERALRAWSPWAPAESVRWLALTLFGIVVWVAGWWGASREAALGSQVVWAVLAGAGFVVVALAEATWLLRARWRISRRTAGLLEVTKPAALEETDDADRVTVGPGLRLMHRMGCQLATGRGWRQVTRATAAREGRQPCGVCQP